MRIHRLIVLIALVATALVALAGCSKTVVYKTPGPVVVTKAPAPPPHAPAHGYRHKHPHGVILVYDAGLGLYAVKGHRNVYFHKNRYYRLRDGAWYVGGHVDGSFKVIKAHKLPPGLKKQWKGNGKTKWKSKKVK